MQKLKSLFSSRFRKHGEKGGIAIFWVMMMPVMFAFLALAVDSSAIQSTKRLLQSSLDSATQGALAQSNTQSSGKPTLGNLNQARQSVIAVYDANRTGTHADPGTSLGGVAVESQSIPFLMCQTNADMKAGQAYISPPSNCGFGMTAFSYTMVNGQPTVSATVSEKADTIFLQILGFDDLYYTIASTATLTSSTV